MTDKEILAAMQNMLQPITQRLDGIEAGLKRLETRQDRLEAGQEKLEAGLKRLETRQDRLEARQEKLEAGQRSLVDDCRQTRVLVENQNHNISLIAEQYGDIARKLGRIYEVDELRDRVRTLERVVLTHTDQIKELKQA